MLMRVGLVLSVLMAAMALAVAGCGGDDEEPAAEATTAAAGGGTVTVDLGEQNGSGQSGTTTLESMDGGMTHVTIELSSPPADPQPAHIHSGTCAELGDVVYPLTNVEGGSSETDVAASLEDLQGADFAVNVHRSEADIGTYVACGDIPQS
jgi:CHRD domain-containing protein